MSRVGISELDSVHVDLSKRTGALYYIPELDPDGAEWNQVTAELWGMGWGIRNDYLEDPVAVRDSALLYALERIA